MLELIIVLWRVRSLLQAHTCFSSCWSTLVLLILLALAGTHAWAFNCTSKGVTLNTWGEHLPVFVRVKLNSVLHICYSAHKLQGQVNCTTFLVEIFYLSHYSGHLHMLHIASFLALYTAQEEYSTKIASQSVCALSGLLVKIFTLSSLFVSFPLIRFFLFP